MSEQQQHNASDIPRGNWVDRLTPRSAHPYLRLARFDRPIGTWLLLLPGWWAVALAPPDGGWPDPWLIILFGVGAILMRGGGCVINDLFDRDFDARVARTADRPIASGAISIPRALLFLAVLFGVSLLILLQFNLFAVAVGAASLLLVVPYPLMKRITWWPQAWLGLTFNWGALLGWAAVRGDIATPALILYAAGFFWTLAYDTIYAHQDKEDDALVGIKSTARLFGDRSRPWIAGFFAVALALLALTGWAVGLSWPFYVGLALAAAHGVWQTASADFDDPKNCLARFKSNRDFGLIVLAAIIAGQVV
ncbi:MAG: 4-hydroxybenzoate octaprenyltransferase [Alphaproteobacteria bacterium]|nr:4-hydroxybenzoate octaprenyltransferase [Alphaproteobacteria bacterium]